MTTVTPTTATPSTLEDNKQIARRYIDEVLNRRDFAAARSFLIDDAIEHATGALSACLTFAAFPDFQISPEHLIAEGDIVTVLATYTGTHTRPFLGIAPTSSGVTGRVAFAFRMSGGRIAESWTEIEPWGLLEQLAPSATS